MKILSLVESYLPVKCGMSEVVSRLSSTWIESGHEVHVATGKIESRDLSNYNVEIHEFNIEGNMVNQYHDTSEEEKRRYKDLLKRDDWDIICVFAAQQWSCDLFLEIIDDIKCKKVFIPTGFSGLFLKEYQGYFKKMETWLDKFDMNVYLSETYRDFVFSKKFTSKTMIIPNGALLKEFDIKVDRETVLKELNIPLDHKVILLVGGHTGMKGHAEFYKMMKKLKIEKATGIIIGNFFNENKKMTFRKPFALLRKIKFYILTWPFYLHKKQCPMVCWKEIEKGNTRVRNLSLSRKQTIDVFHASDLFILPSKIECSPIVLFEAAASSTPFLVTDVGNSREILSWFDNTGEILPGRIDKLGFTHVNISKSVKVLDKWLRKDNLPDLGLKAQNIWKENYTWEILGNKYLNLFKEILNE